MSDLSANGYPGFLIEIKARIQQAQHQALRAVNAELLGLYRDRPKLQPLAREMSWAKNLVVMARCKGDLQREFYLRATAHRVWNMRDLHREYSAHLKLQPLVAEIACAMTR